MKAAHVLISFLLFASPRSRAADAPESPNQTKGHGVASFESNDPFWPTADSPKLITPQWIGEKGVDAAIILAIDDMRMESVPKYEAFLRPIIDRLKKSKGKAPISIMTCTIDPTDPQLQTWLKEGLNFDVHTTKHPCPLLGEKGFDLAKETVHECLDLLSMIPGNKPVAFRMPCCDSMSSPSPRFYAEIFPKATKAGHHLTIDSSVMNLITPADKSLPMEIVHDKEGKDRFAKYFPGMKSDGKWKQKSLRNFGTYIENYPYPYMISKACWEFPCVVPSDWEAYNVLDKASPQMLEDWKAALDAIVLKQGVFTLVFHPHGWSTSQQIVDLIDYAETKYAKRVAFLNFAEAGERMAKLDKTAQTKPAAMHAAAPLPDKAKQEGTRFIDLNGDGNDDIIVSNSREYGVYLFNPVEKKNVQWDIGWTHVMREGKAGDANSIPMIVRADGTDNGVWFKHGAMWVQNEDTAALPDKVRRIPFEELLKVPGPPRLSPADSLKALQLRPGFTAALVANEPLVQDPVFIDWDARGRMWVVEMGDYPFAPGEKTKDGQSGQGKVSDLQTGRVKILEDTNGDGVCDKTTLFLDGLTHPTGLHPWKNGVIVASIPDVFYAEDTNGDGRADKREVLITGFTAGNPQHLVNGFCWGLDGWLYGANGDSGGQISSPKTGKKLDMGTSDFRLNPATGDFALEGGRSQNGKWRDDWGNWFGNNNSTIGWHYYLPWSYLEKHPEIVVKNMRANLNSDPNGTRVFPVSPPLRRFNWAGAINTLTSGCCPMPYRDDLFGPAYQNSLFICEPANNLVHREVLDYSGPTITSRRPADEKDSEFIASRDNWFRPTMARTGPDGALYVVDMYRLVLEHPEWIPAEMVKHLDLRAGEDAGRIYRISVEPPKGGTPTKNLADMDGNALASAMNSTNGWRRDTAQRLLLEKNDASAVPALKQLASTKATPANVRVQAMWTAYLLKGIPQTELVAALKAEYPRVRGAAIVATGSTDPVALNPAELAAWFPKSTAPTKPIATAPVITNINPNRQKVVARYNTEVTKLKGDAKRGPPVFQKVCIACHKLGGMGIEVGPDLATVAAKPTEQLIEAIFDPNRAVEVRNAATEIVKKDGSVIVGLLVADTPGNITLKLPGGVEMAVPRAQVKKTKTLTTSLMLDGLEAVVSPQDCADLLEWIRMTAVAKPAARP